MQILYRIFVVAITALVLVTSACSKETSVPPQEKQETEEMPDITLKLGAQGKELQMQLGQKRLLTNQTAGLDFYKVSWAPPELGRLRVIHSKREFSVWNVFSATGMQDGERASEGIVTYSVLSGLSADEKIEHEAALSAMAAILRNVLNAGWEPYTPRSRPRLMGEDRVRYVLSESTAIGLDARHALSLEQWLQLEDSTPWMFYLDGAYLSISFRRQPHPLVPGEPGIYLVSFDVESAAQFDRGQVAPEDRADWKEKLPSMLKKLSEVRAKREAELSSRGVRIDSAYQDPPISVSAN